MFGKVFDLDSRKCIESLYRLNRSTFPKLVGVNQITIDLQFEDVCIHLVLLKVLIDSVLVLSL